MSGGGRFDLLAAVLPDPAGYPGAASDDVDEDHHPVRGRCGRRVERGAAGQGGRRQAAAHRQGPRRHHRGGGRGGLSDRFGAAGQGDRHDGAHGGADQSRRRSHPDPGAGPAPLGGSAGPLDRLQAAAARCAAARSGPGRGAAHHRGTGRDRRGGDARGRRGDPQRPTRAAHAPAGRAKAGCTGRSTTWTPSWDAPNVWWPRPAAGWPA